MIRIIIYILLSFSIVLSAEEVAEESVDVEIIGNTVSISNNDVWANCCSNFEANIHISGNTITITQRDTSSQKCRCMCLIDLNHDINQLEIGKYEVIIYREELIKYGYDKNRKSLIYRTEIEINSTNSKAALSTFFEQSACKTSSSSFSENLPNEEKVEVFPNPSSGAVTIRFPVLNPDKVSLKLFNFLGKEIKSENYGYLTSGIHTVNFEAGNIPSGMYIGKLVFSSGKAMSFRIIWSK